MALHEDIAVIHVPRARPPKAGQCFSVLLGLVACVYGCTSVGPDFVEPEAELPEQWSQAGAGMTATPTELVEWWTVFGDPVLDRLILTAYEQNYSLEVAGLRVLEARAQLGIAVGNQYPQLQRGRGGVTRVSGSESGANTAAGDLNYWQYDLAADVSWEMDFWGRFRRGIQSADAGLAASIANYDNALVLLISQVAQTYAAIRTAEEQLRVARENVVLQERSLDITRIRFRYGDADELDVQQARTLLLSTQATIPQFEITLDQARNALSTLLARPPGDLADLLGSAGEIPSLPEEIATGVPADLLRRRPDVRQVELQARAQSALIGVAEADLYPSFTLAGSIGVSAADGTDTTRTGDSGPGELFRSDSLVFQGGPAFSWNILNYGRIKNNVRIQDARFQQLLISYQDTVLAAAQEVEDSMVAYVRGLEQERILAESVEAAKRSVDLSTLRYREGLSDYQRVLDAQQSLFTQQSRYVANRGALVASVVGLYKALGGGWQIREGQDFVDDQNKQMMEDRTDWGDLLEPGATDPVPEGERRRPDW
jgi:NodT family efflux transporter outer membrane factor (OMF) lipoprotein